MISWWHDDYAAWSFFSSESHPPGRRQLPKRSSDRSELAPGHRGWRRATPDTPAVLTRRYQVKQEFIVSLHRENSTHDLLVVTERSQARHALYYGKCDPSYGNPAGGLFTIIFYDLALQASCSLVICLYAWWRGSQTDWNWIVCKASRCRNWGDTWPKRAETKLWKKSPLAVIGDSDHIYKCYLRYFYDCILHLLLLSILLLCQEGKTCCSSQRYQTLDTYFLDNNSNNDNLIMTKVEG